MCKAGRVHEAYELAMTDLASTPDNIWTQRAVAWALYYMIKGDAERGNYDMMIEHIDELGSLNLLTVNNDSMIFDNVQFKIAEYIRNYVSVNDMNSSNILSTIFDKLKGYSFAPSRGHSFLLQSYLKFDTWPEMADFIDWWNLEKLTPEDFIPYKTDQGRRIMALAERAFIANSKALLKLKDLGRIEDFLPKMNSLMAEHPEMLFPGYFYGKLLLKLGNDTNEALKVLIPFVRNKVNEFWAWQLLSEVFCNEEEKQLACLLRAVNCHTQETFLKNVRIKLASLYIRRRQYNCARYHIDAVTKCYASQGYRIPEEIFDWSHQQWFSMSIPNSNNPIDYKHITDAILLDGAEECIAVVTYVDQNTHKTYMVYGHEKKMVQKLRFRVTPGTVLKLHYIKDHDGHIKVLCATKIKLPTSLNYAKHIDGTIEKSVDKDFAFLKADSVRCFVSPIIVRQCNLKNGDNVKSLVVFDFDKKRNTWNWVCVDVKK